MLYMLYYVIMLLMQCIVCILYSIINFILDKTLIVDITKDLVGIRLRLCDCKSFKRLVAALT